MTPKYTDMTGREWARITTYCAPGEPVRLAARVGVLMDALVDMEDQPWIRESIELRGKMETAWKALASLAEAIDDRAVFFWGPGYADAAQTRAYKVSRKQEGYGQKWRALQAGPPKEG